MTIPPRFSSDEIADILNATGMRSRVMHDAGPEHHRIDVMIPHQPGCSYRFARDATGWTYLLWCGTHDLRLIVAGTLGECLTFFSLPKKWEFPA